MIPGTNLEPRYISRTLRWWFLTKCIERVDGKIKRKEEEGGNGPVRASSSISINRTGRSQKWRLWYIVANGDPFKVPF